MKKSILIISHLIFWTLALVVELLPLVTADDPAKVQNVLIEEAFITTFSIIIFYSFYLLIAPRILSKRRIFLFLVVFILFIVVYTWLVMLFYPNILFRFIPPPAQPISMIRWYFYIFTYFFIYALWGTMFRFTIDWFASKQRQKELEKQNTSGELTLLRSQINPHFLFNTLNNLNSYIYRDPDKTSNGIVKLSEIMHYMLQEANSDIVPLEKEIGYIKSYIELQKMRVSSGDFVQFTVSGDHQNLMIPPLLLIPFIENAFKHGRKKVSPPGVIIKLDISAKKLNFYIRNYVQSIPEGIEKQGGFGLKNIKRRLDLLYPGRYTLTCAKEDDQFVVNLNITEP